MTSLVTKQQCSICGSPDHTHLHCYGMQAQGAISSKNVTSELREAWDDADHGDCYGFGRCEAAVAGAIAEIERLRAALEWVRTSAQTGTYQGGVVISFSAFSAVRATLSGDSPSTSETSTDDPSPGSSKTEIFNAGVTQAKYRRYYYEALLRVLNSDRMLSHDIARAAICGSSEETTDQSRTVGEHQSGVALRSPDPANVAGGPRPLPESET